MQKNEIKSKLTTDKDLAQIALVLWDNSDYLIRNLTSANVLTKYRAKLVRIAIKMQREAMMLGACLATPNDAAFTSLSSTRNFLEKLDKV